MGKIVIKTFLVQRIIYNLKFYIYKGFLDLVLVFLNYKALYIYFFCDRIYKYSITCIDCILFICFSMSEGDVSLIRDEDLLRRMVTKYLINYDNHI